MQEQASDTSFLKDKTGEVSILFSDPAFVQSDTIVIDRNKLTVFAVFHESAHFLGMISPGMADDLASLDSVRLSSRRGDGSTFELRAPVSVH